jgi:hypothetical protein
MLHRIEVDVRRMLRQVIVIPDLMFPMPPLPYSTLAFHFSAVPHHLVFGERP